MSKNLLISVLQENKHLRSDAEVAAFDTALATLTQSPNEEDLCDLHSVFTDECQHHEVMYGLIHFLESFDMKKQLAAFIEAAPTMSIQAPEWTKIIHCRILNDDESRECFKRLYQSASPAAKEVVKAVLSQIQADDADFSSRVRQLVT